MGTGEGRATDGLETDRGNRLLPSGFALGERAARTPPTENGRQFISQMSKNNEEDKEEKQGEKTRRKNDDNNAVSYHTVSTT